MTRAGAKPGATGRQAASARQSDHGDHTDQDAAGGSGRGAAIREAQRAARERYALIAEALKIEAGVSRHYTHKSISGIAWLNEAKILAPAGVTRRQLYVLAHECGHILLHCSAEAKLKPNHVTEHEAEVYAHRAFARYGLEVPEKSARWARAYVGQWIMKDRADGKAICPRALAFAEGREGPDAPLPALSGQPPHDFSKSLQKHLEKGEKTVAAADRRLQVVTSPVQILPPLPTSVQNAQLAGPPNACGTCLYLLVTDYGGRCQAHDERCEFARSELCNGRDWRPHPREVAKLNYNSEWEEKFRRLHHRGFWSRLGDAIIERVRGRRAD